MNIDQLQSCLSAAHAMIGFYGRFALTFDNNGDAYIIHWFKNTAYDTEDCRAVGNGTIEECLTALDTYVARYTGLRVGILAMTLPANMLPAE